MPNIHKFKSTADTLRVLSAALDAAANGIVLTDDKGLIIWANQAFTRMTGYSADEAIGRTPSFLKSGKQNPDFYSHMWSVISHGEVWHGELINRRKDGSFYTEEMTITPVPDEQGQTSHYIAIKQDVTRRKEVERDLAQKVRELAESNADLEQFAHIASHDLQEPLRKVSNYSELLASKLQGQLDESAEKYISYLVDGTRRMQRLISDLLLFSRAGRKELNFESLSAQDIIRRVLGDLEPLVREKKVHIEVGSLPAVRGNPVMIGQVFQNIISNAVKFSEAQDPKVSIDGRSDDGMVLFSVADNGIGIDPKHWEKIFAPFQRLHTREQYPGTGIGLAVCKKIVERHGGRIWVESNPGQGSTFFFTLPAG